MNEEKLKDIVVGVDFSPESEAALEQAVRLSVIDRAKVVLTHAISPDIFEEMNRTLGLEEEEITSGVRRRLGGMAERYEDSGADITISVAVRHPAEQLLKEVEGCSPQLVVLGSHGAGARQDAWGSVARQAVSHLPADVLLVRNGHGGPSEITSCIDLRFPENDRHVIEAALHVARRESADLEVLHVFYPPWEREGAPEMEQEDSFQKEYAAVISGKVDLFLEGVLGSRADIYKVNSRVMACRGHASGIVQGLLANHTELAVISAPVEGEAGDHVLGGIADQIMRGSGCSVLAVKGAAY